MTHVAAAATRSFWELVEQRANATPSAPMLFDRSRRMTFGTYARTALEVAAGLQRTHGIGEGSIAAWQLPTSIDAMVLMAALSRLGAVQVPIIPALRERELSAIASAAAVEHLIVPRTWRGFSYAELGESVADKTGLGLIVCDGFNEGRAGLPLGDIGGLGPPSTMPADALRWIYFSSGTTADPKGCRHTDRSVMFSATGLLDRFGFSPTDVYPIPYPVAHIGGMTALTTQLVAGSQLPLCDVFDPIESPSAMAALGATVLGSALPFFRAYIDAQHKASSPLFPRLRACIGGGAPRPPALHEEVQAVLGGRGVLGSWGLTECPVATLGGVDDTDDELAWTEGRPVNGVTVAAVGPDGRELSPGSEGELVVNGPQLFSGYLEATLDATAFMPDGSFRTGDLGIVRSTGHVQITGRVKDIIIRNAENISALEVENTIRTHPSIADVAVIPLPDTRTGERACAVVVLTPGCESVSLEQIGAHCRASGLATQKQPEQLHIVGDLPRNNMGKVLKRELIASLTQRQVSGGSE